MVINDDYIFPFGQHKGKKIVNVPASYLLWLFDQPDFRKSTVNHNKEIYWYIKENQTLLEKEAKDEWKHQSL